MNPIAWLGSKGLSLTPSRGLTRCGALAARVLLAALVLVAATIDVDAARAETPAGDVPLPGPITLDLSRRAGGEVVQGGERPSEGTIRLCQVIGPTLPYRAGAQAAVPAAVAYEPHGPQPVAPPVDGHHSVAPDARLLHTTAGPHTAAAPHTVALPPAPAACLCGPSPAAPCPILGVDCAAGGCCDPPWSATCPATPFDLYAQGEYVGHDRTVHVSEYRLRVDDQLEFVYRLTREETLHPYELNVGDEIRVESFTDPDLSRDLVIQPDGSITLRLLGQVRATRHTVAQLREVIDQLYRKYYRDPSITVTPLKVNTKLEDLRATVDSRYGQGGQTRLARVTPEGTIQLPVVGSVPVQGLTLDELAAEITRRYLDQIEGIEVTPVLIARAPRYVYVVGEVRLPGRFSLEGPTTVMQAIALAGGWNIGANLNQVVIFRRGDDWRLLATMLDVRGALYGKRPCPADEIWLNDADVVLVPKSPILVCDDAINLLFTRGLYGLLPTNAVVNLRGQSIL